MLKNCSNANIDCYQGRKTCEACKDFFSNEDQEAFWLEKRKISKTYDIKRDRFVKKYWTKEYLNHYKDYSKEDLLNLLVKYRLKVKKSFKVPYPKFLDTPEYKELKKKYPNSRW